MAQGGVRRAFFSRCLQPRFAPAPHCRAFSSSSSLLQELVPTFTPTSSKELDTLLNKFRTKLFIPMSLSHQYKRIVFSSTKSETLKTHPVAVKVNPGISDEEFILEPLNGNELRRSDTIEVLQRMKTREDWRNFIPFLIGSIRSLHTIRQADLERATRKAAETGNADIIMEAAKRVSETRFSLGNLTLAKAAFRAFRHKAQEAGFKGEGLNYSLRLARQAAWLMNDPVHAPKPGSSELDPKKSPLIAGILLELSAARALDASDGKDVDGYVRMYAKVLAGMYANIDAKRLTREHFWVPVKYGPEANEKLWEMVSVWHGIDLAMQVQEIRDDAKLTEELEPLMTELSTIIEKTRNRQKNYPRNANRLGFAEAKTLYWKEPSSTSKEEASAGQAV